MKIASVAHIKAKFSAYVSATSGGPVVITRNGKAVAAMISLSEEDDLERLAIAYSPRLRSILSAARRRIAAGQAIPHDQFWSQTSPRRAKPKPKRTH